MKKINKLFFLFLFAGALLLSNSGKSQGFSLSFGAAYGFEIEAIGARVGGAYFLSDKMRVSADFTYYLPKEFEPIPSKNSLFLKSSSSKYNYGELNASFHYFFALMQAWGFYGIAALGVHCMGYSYSYDGMSSSDTDRYLGYGVGAGAEYKLSGVSLFAEVKYYPKKFEQLKVVGGFRYNFGGN